MAFHSSWAMATRGGGQIVGHETDQARRILAVRGVPGVGRHQTEFLRLRQKLLQNEAPIGVLAAAFDVERQQ